MENHLLYSRAGATLLRGCERRLTHLYRELELLEQFAQQCGMSHNFPRFHNSYNGSIDLILSVLEHSFVGRALLLLGLFHLHLVYFYSEEDILELVVITELISILHIATSRYLQKYLRKNKEFRLQKSNNLCYRTSHKGSWGCVGYSVQLNVSHE